MMINYFKNNGIIKTLDLYRIYKQRSKGSNSIFYDKGGYNIIMCYHYNTYIWYFRFGSLIKQSVNYI